MGVLCVATNLRKFQLTIKQGSWDGILPVWGGHIHSLRFCTSTCHRKGEVPKITPWYKTLPCTQQGLRSPSFEEVWFTYAFAHLSTVPFLCKIYNSHLSFCSWPSSPSISQRLHGLSRSVTVTPISEFIPHFALTQCNATQNNPGRHAHVSMRTVVLPHQLFQSLAGRSLVDIPWCQGQWQTHSISCINTFYVVTIFILKVISIAGFSHLKNSHFYFHQVFNEISPIPKRLLGKKLFMQNAAW